MPRFQVRSRLMTISIVDRFGSPMPLYAFRGHTIVEAKDGLQYAISFLRNNGRCLNVAAGVDGRYTLENRPFDPTCRGLVYSGSGPHLIAGYGKKVTQSFEFTTKASETVRAETTGDLSKVGLIEVVAWADYVKTPHQYNVRQFMGGLRRDSAESMSGARSGADGTKMGNDVEPHQFGTTNYERVDTYPDVIRIYPRAHWWLHTKDLIFEPVNEGPTFP